MAKTPIKPDLKTYVARQDGWVAGRYLSEGETIELSARAAKYEAVDPIKAAEDAPAVPPLAKRPAKSAE